MKKIGLAMLAASLILSGCSGSDALSPTFQEQELNYLSSDNHMKDTIMIKIDVVKLDEGMSLGVKKTPDGKETELSQVYLDEEKYLNLIKNWDVKNQSRFYMNLNKNSKEPSVSFAMETVQSYIESIEGVSYKNQDKYKTTIGEARYGVLLLFKYDKEKKQMVIDYNKKDLKEIERLDIAENVYVEMPLIESVSYKATVTLNKDATFIQRYNNNEYMIFNFKLYKPEASK